MSQWASSLKRIGRCTHRTQPYEVIGIERLPTVWADPVLIQEVWCNLMDNAFKYSGMREVTRLEWNACPLDDGWTVSLHDNGCGFDASEQAHVFEMFGRLKNPTNIEGDGIGLALCRRIVQSHDGRIWAESTPEHGSVFHVWLPCEGAKSAVRPPSAGWSGSVQWTADHTARASTVSRTS